METKKSSIGGSYDGTYMIWGIWIIASILCCYFGIKGCHKIQCYQSIYGDSPKQHQIKKGTPTMGGIFIVMSFLLGVLLLNQWDIGVVWVVMSTCLFSFIGFIDDILSLKNKLNQGLTAKTKFFIQLVVSTGLVLTFHGFIQELRIIEILLYIFLLIGTSNATNLTDGVDGLLSVIMIISLTGMSILFYQIMMINELLMVGVMMISIGVFLIFNWNPAKIFMGDTGSLMLGAFLASMCILSGKWVFLIGFGGIYIIETLSVIIQVVSYKLTKKRLFLMSPLHHHFELLGFREVSIVILFSLVQIILIGIQLIL